MHKRYDHKQIEKKWQEKWQTDGLYDLGERDDSKEKEYVLVEWPYPSGNLHIGHWHAFAVPDIYVRYQRMLGKQVLFPMGFDAFGLPAENAAIKRNLNPREWTYSNMEYMRGQLNSMGNAFSWDMTTSSTDPEYYKWTQWMFGEFFKNKIAYRGEGVVNWCPGCNTVIANEQVQSDDTCERCDSLVEKRKMPQWMLKITDFADALIDDLETVEWPEHIKDAQRNWIGRSNGAEIDFKLNVSVKKRVLILHGFGSTPDDDFIPWLKASLEKSGHEVVVPILPHSDRQNVSEEESLRIAKEAIELDENTIVVAHSLGCLTALRLVEQASTKIDKLVLCGGFVNLKFKDKERPFADKYDWSFDGNKIIENTSGVVVLHDSHDHVISDEQAEELAELLHTSVTSVTASETHFNGAEEPAILKAVNESITVFTTRPDTLYGATYMVLAPEHKLVQKYKNTIENWSDVEGYIQTSAQKDERERLDAGKVKTGVILEGVTATNPTNGEQIPVYIADYVLASYGTGAIMAVPAHDERDFDFAEKYSIEIKQVVSGNEDIPFDGSGQLINSGEFDGMDSEKAKIAITKKVGGKMTSTYRLRDWSIGRQRYWGVPIPIVYDPDGKAHAIPEAHLPWTLPEDVDFKPTGEPPLAKSAELKDRTEKIFGAGWTPEVETMDTFVDSSWYFLRYIDNHNEKSLSSIEAQKTWMPIDLYFGGSEHTTMHLLYSRFWQKALYKLGLVAHNEPYRRRINRGLILGPDGNKMSKSKGNVIDPDEQVGLVGADTVKMYLAFMGPYGEVSNYPWDMGGIAGLRRFLERVNGLADHFVEKDSKDTSNLLHKTIKKVREDIVSFKFNTAISAMMVFVNHAEKSGLSRKSYGTFLRLLAPFAPHLTEDIWSNYHDTSIHLENYPEFDEALVQDELVTIGVQINGKMRGEITLSPVAEEDEALKLVKSNEKLAAKLSEAEDIKKVIYVKGRILNIIVN